MIRNRRLSEQLARLAVGCASRPVPLGELVEALQLRGHDALLLVFAFPFVLPVSVPGLSTPFGLVIAMLGFRLMLARSPWIPKRFASKVLPPGLFAKPLLLTSRAVKRLEKLVRPRLWYPDFPTVFRRAGGAIAAVCGLLLLLPVPVPFSNMLPAVTIVLVAVAGLERDGAFFLAGCLNFAVSLLFFGLLAYGGREFWETLTC